MHDGRLSLEWFGWKGLGLDDDSGRLQAAVDALPAGGTIEAGLGKLRIEQTITVTRVPIVFAGIGSTDNDEYSTQIVVATGSDDGFRLSGVRGGGFRDLQMRGEGLADELYDLSNLLYLDEQTIRIVKVTRRLATGTCSVRLDADGSSAGGSAVAVSTTLQTTNLANPFVVNSADGARRLQVRVLGAASAGDLEVQFAYQVVG